jgi:hypothetical protein
MRVTRDEYRCKKQKSKETIMKHFPKISLVLLAVACFTFTMNAQSVRVSPQVGVNFSAVDAQIQDIRAESRVGWNAGLDFRFGEKLIYFNPGIQYFSNTARLIKDVGSPDDVNFEEETTIQSLKAPLNLGLRLTGDNGLLGLRLRGGVTPTYVLGVNEKADFAFSKEDLNAFTWGANVGAGVDVLFFTLDVNYEIGLNDYFQDAEGRNNVLSLNLGLKF